MVVMMLVVSAPSRPPAVRRRWSTTAPPSPPFFFPSPSGLQPPRPHRCWHNFFWRGRESQPAINGYWEEGLSQHVAVRNLLQTRCRAGAVPRPALPQASQREVGRTCDAEVRKVRKVQGIQ
ncbi:hypothetical protein PLESTM_001341000 [Pleodorina starrii]|nr:hypothetical protein PLESTM_001341000 [Pleodorina starrii]